MAKFLSQVYTSIRGRVGGIVYTKNQFAGLIARAFTAPTNPGTDLQELIRSCMSEASQKWTDLLQSERDLWNAYAATLVYEGPHGEYKLPGRQVFISNLSLAFYLDTLGGSSIAVDVDPPLLAGFENIGTVESAVYDTVSSEGVAISVGNPNAYDLVVLLQRSIGFNQTKNVYNGPWLPGSTMADDLTASASTKFQFETGTGTAGQVFFLRVRAITATHPHRITNDFTVRCIAVANGP
jgi:hypothetical protein